MSEHVISAWQKLRLQTALNSWFLVFLGFFFFGLLVFEPDIL